MGLWKFFVILEIADYGLLGHIFVSYQTIELLIFLPANKENYRTIGSWILQKLSVAQLRSIHTYVHMRE
jgi:hypothetical protein